ncbi:uncharacterized protein LAJ45_10525 [Morchella importuna]|uniref:uncharacterized protein n=1 Tax=Morchella importuna TaxID=1174673 RepID=UPI001E8ED912|nr:uncharacterized protein LAJ45_10525 [Morchella importuna]KAH8145404.1 hypothetical protein LAJ45_10525 [Morchella importuna]
MKVAASPLVLFTLVTTVPLMAFILLLTLLPTPKSALNATNNALRHRLRARISLTTDDEMVLRPAFAPLEAWLDVDERDGRDERDEGKRVVVEPLLGMRPQLADGRAGEVRDWCWRGLGGVGGIGRAFGIDAGLSGFL